MDRISAPVPHLREPAAKISRHTLVLSLKSQEPPNMRIKAIPFLGALLLAVSGCDKTTNSSPSQSVDPAIARGQAQTLTIGATQTGSLRKGEVDWFKFAVDSGRTYSLQQSCPQDPCPEARTLKAQWKSASALFDSSASGLLRFTAAKTDSVYVSFEGQATSNGTVSTSFGYWDSVNYALELMDHRPAEPSTSTRTNARLMPLDGSAVRNSMKSGETSWYKFPVAAQGVYEIQLAGDPTNHHGPGRLFFKAFLGNSAIPFDSTKEAFLRLKPATSDTVFLAFQGDDFYWDSVHYTLSVKENIVPSSDTVSGDNLTPSTGPKAWIATSTSTVKAGGTLGVHLADSVAGASIVKRRIGAPWNVDVSGKDTSLTFPSDSGTIPVWYCVTDNRGDSACTYVLIKVKASPDTIAVASAHTLLTDGTIAQGNLSKTETTWYKFQSNGNALYRIQESCNTPTCLMGNKITLIAYPSGDVLSSSTSGVLYYTTKAPGVILIKFQGATDNDAGPYTLWALEYDNTKAETMATAIDIEPGTTRKPRLAHQYPRDAFNWSFDITWFRFHADSGKTYRFTHPDRELYYQRASFWTIDSVLVPSAMANYGPTEEAFACTKTGTYFVRFAPWPTNPDGSTYSVRLQATDHLPYWFTRVDDFEPDSTMHTASALKPDSSAMHHTLPPKDVDWTRIPVDSGKVYLIGIREALRPYTFSLYAADSTLLQFQMTNGNSFYPSIKGGRLAMSYLAEKTTDIYVRISSLGDSLEYDLRAWTPAQDSFEADDAPAAAKELSTDGSIQHRLLTGTFDHIKFHADSGKTYWVNLHVTNSSTVMGYTIFHSGQEISPERWGQYRFLSDRNQDVVIAVNPNISYTDEPPLLTTTRYDASVTIETADSYESDNTRSTAKSQTTDGAIARHNLTTSDVDWISFEVDSGATYSVNISNPEAASIRAGLYTADSSLIGNAVEGTASTLTLQATARRKTTYNLQVTSPWYSGPPVKYDVTIQSSKASQ